MANKLNEYMTSHFDMKTFNHMPLQTIPEVYTQSIKGANDFM